MNLRQQTAAVLYGACIAMITLCPPYARPASAQQTDVLIRSTPSGASVTIDGRTAGVTPLSLATLPAGKHLVNASLRGFRPLFKTVDVVLEQSTVLDLVLEPLTGLLLIHSTPPGAELEINDISRGTTPLLISDLPPGAYRARLSKSGFLPRLIDFTVDGRIPKRIETTLSTDTATLTIKTVPQGASISLDGIAQSASPCTLENVRTGEVSINVTAPGHRLFAETVVLKAGEHREMEITLQPEPSSLTLSTTPAGAKIFVDEKFRGRSPVKMSNIAAGDYAIRTELDAHDSAIRTVHVALGRDYIEDFSLVPNAGRIEITTEPAGVSVLFNGMPSGETAPEPGKTDSLSALFTMPLVPVGTHLLTLTKVGYYPLTRQITIVRNETLTGHYILKRRFIPNTQVQVGNETYRGILVERDVETLKLELRPGVFKTLRVAEITLITPLRTPEIPEVTPPATGDAPDTAPLPR